LWKGDNPESRSDYEQESELVVIPCARKEGDVEIVVLPQ